MKKGFLVSMFLVIAMSAAAQVRTQTDIKKMVKNGTECYNTILQDGECRWNNLAAKKEISLNNPIKNYELNEIEKILVTNYDDVRLSEGFLNGYFVVKDSAIGLYDLNGKIIVPPIPGYPRAISGSKSLYFGDSMPIENWNNYIMGARGKARRAYAGSFAVIINKETLKPVIPLGKFDGIHYTFKGWNYYYYVSKLVDGDLKWGVYNKMGEEVVPCQYDFVGLKDGEYYGDNSKVMEDVVAELNPVLARRRYNFDHRLDVIGDAIISTGKAIGQAAVAVGNAIVDADEALRESGTYDALNSLAEYYGDTSINYTSVESSCSNTPQSSTNYSTHNSQVTGTTMSAADQQNYNTLRKTYNKWASDLMEMKNANGKYQNGYSQNDKRHAQSEMKRIRNMAKSKWGKDIDYNSLEDW